MRTRLQRVGKSRAVIISKRILARVGFGRYIEVVVENGALVLRQPNTHPRDGWEEASRALSSAGEDALVWPEFPNQADAEIAW